MHALNPDVRITPLQEKLNAAQLDSLVAEAQVVLDCCDNFQTRQAINAACVKHRVPLVSGAAIRMDGQLAVYDARDAASPCYACVFPPDTAPEEAQCATLGVLAPLVGVMGSLQAMEAVKLLSGIGSRLTGQLQLLDGRDLAWTSLRLARNPHCPVCGQANH
jgi:molybdopterin/thiamine biosynthesis adenylyltransferase